MGNTLILSVIAGMSLGIVLVIVLASMPVAHDISFGPESYYDWSPEAGGSLRLVLTETFPGLVTFVPDETGDELNENPYGSECHDPEEC